MKPIPGIVVTLTPLQWGDVLRGLGHLSKQPFISEARAKEILALYRNVGAQVERCESAGDPPEARRRDYDRDQDFQFPVLNPCERCSSTGFVDGGFCTCERGVGRRALAYIRDGRTKETP